MRLSNVQITFLSLLALFTLRPIVTVADTAEDELRRVGVINFDAWNSRDIDALTDGGWTRGFGFRSLAPRTEESYTAEVVQEILVRFFESIDYYRVTPGETTVAVDGDIGLIWGFHTEEIKHKGRPPERYRVRSSATLRRDASGNWRTILSHRDIQPYNEDGQYIPTFETP
jgi:hypothetical protein